MTLLEVKDISVRYGDQEIIKNISFSVGEGQWLMIAGPNGAGKSTVVNAVSRAVPCSGTILFKGTDINKLKPQDLARHMGVLQQRNAAGYDFTVNEIAGLGRYAYKKGVFKKAGDNTEDEKLITEAIRATGMETHRYRPVTSLSGGEVQRAFLAQLFAQDPDIMILDEPANHLDLLFQKQIFEMISRWLETPGKAVISVVHDLSTARMFGSSTMLMDKGTIAAYGSTKEVLSPDKLRQVYGMDVYDWMKLMLSQWQ